MSHAEGGGGDSSLLSIFMPLHEAGEGAEKEECRMAAQAGRKESFPKRRSSGANEKESKAQVLSRAKVCGAPAARKQARHAGGPPQHAMPKACVRCARTVFVLFCLVLPVRYALQRFTLC